LVYEGVGLIDRAISFQDLQPICDPDPPTLQTDRRTDGRHAISIPCYALVHRAVKTSRRKREREFFWDRQLGVHWSCYVLLFTDFVNFGQSCLSDMSSGAIINSTRYIQSDRAYRPFVTETCVNICQYILRCVQYDRLSQQQLSLLFWPTVYIYASFRNV